MAEAAAARKKFLKKALDNLHGTGLMVREINMTNFQRSLDKKANTLQRHLGPAASPGLQSAAQMVVEFQRLRNTGVLSALCSTYNPARASSSRASGLSANFVRQALANGPGELSFRTDTVVVIAYSLQRRGQQVVWEPVGVAAYGSSDKVNTNNQEVTFADNSLDAAVKDKNIVEIDLLCAKGADPLPRSRSAAGPSTAPAGKAPPGTGAALLAYCLARAAMRKKGGEYRYRGAVLVTAADPATSAMGRVARRMGFESAPATVANNTNGSSEKYFALYDAADRHQWVTTAMNSLSDLPLICQRGTRCQ